MDLLEDITSPSFSLWIWHQFAWQRLLGRGSLAGVPWQGLLGKGYLAEVTGQPDLAEGQHGRTDMAYRLSNQTWQRGSAEGWL